LNKELTFLDVFYFSFTLVHSSTFSQFMEESVHVVDKIMTKVKQFMLYSMPKFGIWIV